jgi:hypothetical protein
MTRGVAGSPTPMREKLNERPGGDLYPVVEEAGDLALAGPSQRVAGPLP